GGINRPPMERTAGVAALYEKAVAVARDLGWKLDEAAVGGGSDGNFTAGLGIPTLDGLGGVGDGAHAVHEHIVVSELPRRAALLLILAVALLIFGPSKLADLGKGLGEGIKNFKSSMKDGEEGAEKKS